MRKIYSKVEPDLLLHIIVRLDDIEDLGEDENSTFRMDIIPENNFLQCSALHMDSGQTFRPHKHIFKKRTHEKQIAQESWVVIRGSVKCTLFDIDDTPIAWPVLEEGDASFTLRGGHTYEILDNDTIVYEFKTGPYEGQKLDKTFINEKQ